MPLMYKGNHTFYNVGDEFEVVEEKQCKLMGLGYRLKYMGCVFDGYANASSFEEIEEKLK